MVIAAGSLVDQELKELIPAENNSQVACGSWAVISECLSGLHHFAKQIYCGKEWCPVCGQKRSAAHNRRIARVLPKAMQIKEMGYFVIEFPDRFRTIGKKGIEPDPIDGCWCYSKKDLQDTTNRIVNVMAGKRSAGGRGQKRVGGYFKRGLVRWHWFGDKIPGKWNPHANILVDSAYIENEKLEMIKADLKEALKCPDLIVNYHYYEQPGQKFNKVEYITRSTFLNIHWNEYMASELFNFRNQRWWGQWHDEAAWSAGDIDNNEGVSGMLEASILQKGLCPDCGRELKTIYVSQRTGRPVKWSRPVDSAYLIIWQAKEMSGTGYFRIDGQEWSSGPFAARGVLT